MEERLDRPATSFGDAARSTEPEAAPRFQRPTVQEITLSCEISAYAPDGDDRPLF